MRYLIQEELESLTQNRVKSLNCAILESMVIRSEILNVPIDRIVAEIGTSGGKYDKTCTHTCPIPCDLCPGMDISLGKWSTL